MTRGCLHYGMSFVNENSLVLQKNAKHRSPDKVYFCTISGVSLADVDWCTSSNNSSSGVTSCVEVSNKSGSTTLDNDRADRGSG